MTTVNTDLGTSELDKLIHSYEFENQQYVKMIDKENQLINSLQAQVQCKSEQASRFEEEISRFDEDTKRLHRQYTNNRDNILSLKSTLNVMSDHELALSKQLEITKAKTETDCKFYQNQVAYYSNTRDDYMKKYQSFPPAIELDHRKLELAEVQKKVDDMEIVKKELREKISLKEEELDSKVMSRIIVKIAKTKLETAKLEKEIHECLTEKTELLEKLRELQISKQPEQVNRDSACDYEDYVGETKMDTDDEESNGSVQTNNQNEVQTEREEMEEDIANLSINDSEEKSALFARSQVSSGGMVSKLPDQNCTSPDDMAGLEDNPGLENASGSSHSLLEGQAAVVSGVQQWNGDSGAQYRGEKLNDVDASEIQIQTESVTHPEHIRVATSEVQKQPSQTREEWNHASPGCFSSNISRLPVPNFRKATQSISGTKEVTENDTHKPPSLRIPRLTVPRPPRVPPPPTAARPSLSALQQQLASRPSVQIKQPPPPPAMSVSKDSSLNQKQNSPQVPKMPRLLHQQTIHPTLKSYVTSSGSESVQSKEPVLSKNSRTFAAATEPSQPPAPVPKLSKPEKQATIQGRGESAKQMEVACNLELPKTQKQPGHFSHMEKNLHKDLTSEEGDGPGFESTGFQPAFKLAAAGDSCSDLEGKNKSSAKGIDPEDNIGTSANGSEGFSLGSLFGKFGNSSNNEDTDEMTVPSIFNLLNLIQHPVSENSDGEPNDEPSFLTFGKFTDDAASPGSEGGPSNLLNLFSKSQASEHSEFEFAINLSKEGDESKDGTGDGNADNNKSFLSFSGNFGSDEEAEPPLFNLF